MQTKHSDNIQSIILSTNQVTALEDKNAHENAAFIKGIHQGLMNIEAGENHTIDDVRKMLDL